MAAPSFSSFPPSFTSFPDLDEGPSKPKDELPVSTREDIRKHGKTKKDKEIKDWKQKRDGRKYVEEFHKSGDLNHRFLDDERLKFREDVDLREMLSESRSDALLFYSDRKGDPLNVQYGGLHAGDIPKHHLVGRGTKILGLGDSWSAARRRGKGVEVYMGIGRRMPQLTDPKARSLLASAPKRRLLKSTNPFKYEEGDGFIRLPSRRGQQDAQDYRSITKRPTDSDSNSSDSDSDQPSTDDDSDSMQLTSYQEMTKSLDQKLTANPSSISTWLSMLSHSLSTVPLTSKNAVKARSEITVSLMSRALSAHPDNTSSKIIRLKYLMAGEEIWHESKLRAEWENALKIGGAEIWMEWLEWRMRTKNRGINGMVEDAVRVLQSIGQDELGKVRVLWRLAVAFQAAGYSERATALFQAQIELVFNLPPALSDSSWESQLAAFEEFWDSEAPRMGEPGARGWAAWSGSSEQSRIPASSSHIALQSFKDEQSVSDPYVQWAFQEAAADRTIRMPTRSCSETDESDLYGTILFDDIRPLLTPLRSTCAKSAIRLAWLSMLGLHIPGFAESLSPSRQTDADDRWCHTYLANLNNLSALFPSDATHRRITTDAFVGAIIGREREYMNPFGPVKNWGYGIMAHLEEVDGKSSLWTKETVQGTDEPLITRIFAQLRQGEEDPEWDVLCLAFEAATSVKTALKTSKSFLSTARDSLTHWAAYARLERLRVRIEDARKVYQTVLVTSARPRIGPGVGQLWWDWAEMEWLAGLSDNSVDVIVQSAGVSATGGIRVLRSRRNLEEAATAETRREDQEAWVKLLALLECLTTSMDVALAVFDRHLVGLESGSVAHESLMVASLLLLYRQGTLLRCPVPPAMLRSRVEKALEIYPSNTIVLGMFLEAEKGQGVWGRVRNLLGEGTAREKDVSRRVIEVWIPGWERGRWYSEKERIRNGLTVAVENERTRYSGIIWRIYIEFEIRMGELQLAKKLLYRAIGECPLVKELYLLAFGPLRSVFSAEELNAYCDTMAERELRMRRGVDEFLEGWAESDAVNGSDGNEESEDEIEHNANELVRLRPY